MPLPPLVEDLDPASRRFEWRGGGRRLFLALFLALPRGAAILRTATPARLDLGGPARRAFLKAIAREISALRLSRYVTRTALCTTLHLLHANSSTDT